MADRVAWSDDSTEIFLDICLEMKAGGLSKVNWDRIVSTLNVKSGKNFNIKQARNHWDDLRKRFKIWNEMELNWTGLTFDPITGCPVVEQDDRWNIFVKVRHFVYPFCCIMTSTILVYFKIYLIEVLCIYAET